MITNDPQKPTEKSKPIIEVEALRPQDYRKKIEPSRPIDQIENEVLAYALRLVRGEDVYKKLYNSLVEYVNAMPRNR